MRSVKSLLTVVCIALMSNFSFAGDVTGVKKSESDQIKSYLNKITYNQYINAGTKLNISFFINSRHEIIVVSTSNTDLDGVVKSTLNYEKIEVKDLEYNKLYTIPVDVKIVY
ncbi:MAG: hypothetical protein IPO92_12075 [Saprospiraceae bacterium]|nr:hypothetical protein [Saprospiraceae bacterium]